MSPSETTAFPEQAWTGTIVAERPEQARAEDSRPVKSPTGPLQRNVAVDAYRGLVMLLMMGEVLRFAHVAQSFPHSLFWRVLAFNQSHVQWVGMVPRYHPAFVHFPGGGSSAILAAKSAAKGRELSTHAGAHHLA